MHSHRGAAGGRHDKSGSGCEWGKYSGVKEWTLSVGHNRYAPFSSSIIFFIKAMGTDKVLK
jgi:hypothetical protein